MKKTKNVYLGAAVKKMLVTLTTATMLLFSGLIGADEPSVGFVLPSEVGDHGWTYRHDVGRQTLEQQLGVKTTVIAGVSEKTEDEQAIRRLAESGPSIIFTTSFGFEKATTKAAEQFPDIKFENATGYHPTDNMGVYAIRFYEGRAVLGTIAGHMSKSGIAGYVASEPIPEVIRGINAFTLAMRKVNPDAIVKVIWTYTWYDRDIEAAATTALINQGADIITQHTNSPGPLQVAQQRGVHGFGKASDMSDFAPKAHLTSMVDNWGAYYVSRVKAVMQGTWKSTDTWGGMKDGMIEFTPYSDAVPAKARAAADRVKQSIIDDPRYPFQGPITNQAGKPVIDKGEALDDVALLNMFWYVEGVDGDLGF